MSKQTQLELAVWFAAFCALLFLCLIVWLACCLTMDWLDRRMQNSRRIKNRKLDANYRTKQFSIPTQFRDFK